MAAGKGVSKLFKAAFEGSNALIRKCGKWAGKQVDNVTSPVKKLISKRRSINAARRQRDELFDKLSPMDRKARKDWLKNRGDGKVPTRNGPTTVTGATDPETGISRAGVNSRRSGQPRTDVDVCAEDDALHQINVERQAQGLPPVGRNDVYYSEARDLYDGTEKPICAPNCQEVSDPDRYPDNVRWDDQVERPDGTTGPSRWKQMGK